MFGSSHAAEAEYRRASQMIVKKGRISRVGGQDKPDWNGKVFRSRSIPR